MTAPGKSGTRAPKAPHVQRRWLAIPVLRGRVAPVLDTCTRLVVLNPQGALASGHKVRIEAGPMPDRVLEFQILGIRRIVCGAVSEHFCNLLEAAGIQVVSGVAGDLEAVASACRNGTLAQTRFRMPGTGEAPGEPDAP